jgi:energy-coupling factor transport system ATP-binding protein
MAENVIEIQDVSFTYTSGTKALDRLSLEVKKGEYVAIMGPNGAGKSTLCLLLNGVIPNVLGGRMTGSVQVVGLNTFDHYVYELAVHVGMVLQDPETQLFSSDVSSEVAFAAENRGVEPEEILRRLQWVLETVRLNGVEKRTPQQLSGGQKQRLAIAANLVVHPEILVLDEPTSQLDPVGTEEVFSVLRKLNREMGITIVLSSHNSEMVAQYADRIILLDKGKKVDDGTPKEIFSNIKLLKRISVKIPEVTLVGYSLQKRIDRQDLPITLDQCEARIAGLLNSGVLAVKEREPNPHNAEAKEKKQEPHIVVDSVSYVYPGAVPFKALDKVSLVVNRGEFVGLVGQNGSGKTTLLKNILGVLNPTEGKIYIDMVDSTKVTVAEWARKVGLVLQNPDPQLFKMSAEEEVAFGLWNLGLPQEEIARRVDRTLEMTGLSEFRKLYPFNFSFGNRRKLAVAAVVAMEPQVLIFDEPTTGQDYKGRYELAEIARELNEKGSTVVMVTHDMDLITKYTTRVFVLSQGRLLMEGTTREVFSRPDILAETFLSPPQVTQLAQRLSPYNVPPDVLSVKEFSRILA